MKFLKIKETCIYTSDLRKALEFYHKILGLPVINYSEKKHLFLKCGTSVLLLFNPEDSKNKKSPPSHFGGGKQHFAFEIESSSYEKTKTEILEKGITIIDEVTWPSGAKSFYFNDAEGNVLEILPDHAIWD